MNKRNFLFILLMLGMVLSAPMATLAQEKGENGNGAGKEETKDDSDEKEKKDKTKLISEYTEACKAYEGLFTIFQDTTKGDLYLQIEADKFNKQFIYFGYAEDGVPTLGMFRGAYRGDHVFSLQKYFNRIEFKVPNHNFYFDPENPISKAAHANISDGIIFSADIVAASAKKDTFLIEADELFMKETLANIKPQKSRRGQYSVGKLAKDKSKVSDIRNFPKNTDVVIEYVFENSKPDASAGPVLADDRSVSFLFQHTFIEMPDNDYEPRKDDPRIGYFTSKVNDMTSSSVTPYRDVIRRWNLKKKNPGAALSEPVKPIVFWIENTTPYELRPMVRKGVENWNKAFEKAGFKNAVVVKQMPDDADWHPGDIRYNVIRWTSSPTPRFGGYGPSFYNPISGEILGADVMLEYAQFVKQLRYKDIFEGKAAQMADETLLSEEALDSYVMSDGEMMAQSLAFGEVMASTPDEYKGMVEESIISLVTHEVGHTLGLTHNFKGSFYLSPEKLNDVAYTKEHGLTASIMDYTLINIANNPEEQGQYFSTTVGPYDIIAIEYGYKPEVNEEELTTIAEKVRKQGLHFGNDADDMRDLRRGMDPRALTWDLSNDPIAYSIDRIELVKRMMQNLPERFVKEGESYHELRYAFSMLMNQYKTSIRTISRYVGGIYIDRSFAGQEGADIPYTPVAKRTQKRAMDALYEYVFAEDAFQFDEKLLRQMQFQRRGFNVGADAMPIHYVVNSMQKEALAPLMYYGMFNRMLDAEKFGSDYKLADYMTDLNDMIFQYDYKAEINTYQQYIQYMYVRQLTKMFGKSSIFNPNRYPKQARALAIGQLHKLQKKLKYRGDDELTKSHQEMIQYFIENSLRFM